MTNGLRVGVVGFRWRGNELINQMRDNVVALCDVDEEILAQRCQEHQEVTGRAPEKYVDYRDMLEKADLDAVAVATPNHTHCLISIAALQAGKHVYCEKPISHNVWEGRQLVAASREHDRIVQCGTQSRSSVSLKKAVEFVRSGKLGAIQYAIGTCYKPRPSIGKLEEPLEIPKTINYDLWCGPAKKEPLYRSRVHYDWHWDTNTGNGDMGNQGIHQMDIARWFLGEDRLAPRVLSIGGRLGYDDAGNTPNSQIAYFDYAAAPLIFETRGLPRSKAAQKQWGRSMDRYRGSRIGVIIQCEGGHVVVTSYTKATAYDRAGNKIKQWKGGGSHTQNWLQAITRGDRSLLNAEIQEGHLSSSLCHVGCASHQLGEKAVANDIMERIAAMPLLSSSFDRLASHLRANQVDIDSDQEALTLGAWLDVDTETERFTGGPEGTDPESLFKRAGRGEFMVTDYKA